MISTFLKAKHWQLGLVLIAPVILVQILTLGTSLFHIEEGTNIDPNPISYLLIIILLVTLLLTFVLLGWFWSISIGLQSKLPKHLKMKTKAFKIFNLYTGVYTGLLCSFLIIAPMSEWMMELFQENLKYFFLIIPLHLFAMFCIIYCMYFSGKTLKTVELQREAHRYEYYVEILLFWFSFIGVWIIQPRVNKLVNQELPENQQA